jgi:hypothetical protein
LKTDGSFSCDKIPCKTIWDCSTPREFSLGSLALRHCGVQFGKLGDDQKVDLKYFIENHTTDKAESWKQVHIRLSKTTGRVKVASAIAPGYGVTRENPFEAL